MKTSIKHVVMACVFGILMLAAGRAPAMDRWAALSMLESGNNDAAIGRAGEISRFQIKPALWYEFGDYPLAARTNSQAALAVARAIMLDRCMHFRRRYHRDPTNFEYYVLWNAPAQIGRPARAVTERAIRFCQLTAT